MKPVITFGEIMLRLSPPGFLRFSQASSFDVIYGGGESNVAVSLAHFGVPVEYVTRLPENDIGDCVIGELRKRGVGTNNVVRGGSRVGIYFCETGAVHRGSKVIYDRAGSSIAEIEPAMVDWKSVFSNAEWFHWTGITPAISQGAAAVCLEAVRAANAAGVTVSTDLNYRRKLWKWGKTAGEVMEDLVAGCDVILGNEEDAHLVFGIHPEGVDVTTGHVEAQAYESVARQLMERFPKCKKVIITLRGSKSASHNTWSGVLWNGSQLIQAPTYDITHIVDRVGGGDSFMAGLIYGLTHLADDEGALNFAVAASALKHTIYGDANLVTVDEVQKLAGGDASGRVSR
jgi:2-dehydro-3-deoxygluconokinase